MFKLLALAFVLAVSWASAVVAGEEEELGVEMKTGTSSTEAVGKARDLAGKYDRAKQSVANALGGEGPMTPSDPAAGPEKEAAPASAPAKKTKAAGGSDIVHLTNGQTIPDAKIIREDAGGMVLDMDGAEVYFTRQEIKSVERGAS